MLKYFKPGMDFAEWARKEVQLRALLGKAQRRVLDEAERFVTTRNGDDSALYSAVAAMQEAKAAYNAAYDKYHA